jgi:hypothetical protein
MTTIYKQRECYKCGVGLVVPHYDDSTYAYCQPCAFSKIGGPYDNRTERSDDDR